jgi:signal transduction histidine kinase
VSDRTKRILIAAAIGTVIAVVTNRVDAELTRLAVPLDSTILDDLIIGFVAGLCAYSWASFLAERISRRSSAESLRQEGVLRERTRISCEIHDTLAQGFAGIVVNLEAACDFLGEAAEARTLTDRALRIGRESLAEARALLKDLRSPRQEGESLHGTVAHLASTLVEGTGLKATFFVDEIPRQVSPDTETELLRIIREAITNIVRHAVASELRVTVRADNNQIHLCVEDDGRGFETANAFETGKFGLTSMRERARRLGGVLWYFSQRGRGTAVIALIPVSRGLDSRSEPCNITVPFESSSPTTTRSSVTDSVQS